MISAILFLTMCGRNTHRIIKKQNFSALQKKKKKAKKNHMSYQQEQNTKYTHSSFSVNSWSSLLKTNA